MSLTNEQRAHDIAIASLPFIKEVLKNQLLSTPEADPSDYPFDIYYEYKNTYEQVLESLNRDFTN